MVMYGIITRFVMVLTVVYNVVHLKLILLKSFIPSLKHSILGVGLGNSGEVFPALQQ